MRDLWLDSFVSRAHTRASEVDISQQIRYAGRLVFGDRVGVVLWLGVVLSLGLFWRVGFFITDTYPIANAVANLADGRLAMQPRNFQYSLTLGTQPGLHEYQGQFYARNYGQVVAAVPIVWLLEALSIIAAPRLALAAIWSVGVVVFGRAVASLLNRPQLRVVGSTVAIVSFVAAVLFATELGRDQLPLVALQLSTLVAAGFVAVFCYRLVASLHSRKVAVAAGSGLALATPVGFWSTIPKRHVLVTALVFASVYAFTRSRQLDGLGSDLSLGSAYSVLGLLAWVHAFEGFFLVVTLFVVDFVTEPRKGGRRVALVGGMFVLSVLPMVLTNMAISGNPLRPPRLLPNVGPGSVELAPETVSETGGTDESSGTTAGGETAGGEGRERSGSSGDNGTTGSGGSFDGVLAPLLGVLSFVQLLLDEVVFIGKYAAETVSTGVDDIQSVGRLWDIFVRRGDSQYTVNGAVNEFELIDLSVLESTPVVGSLLTLPFVAVAHLRRHGATIEWRSPRRQTDLLVVAYISVLTIVYLPRLPLHSQITVRYLLPAMALMAYCTVRLPTVREGIHSSMASLGKSYVLTVALGTGAMLFVFGSIQPALGEAMQFHALVGLTGAGLLTLTVTARNLVPDAVSNRVVAVSLGVTTGVTTLFLIFAAFGYFQYGPFALDVAGEFARHLSLL